MQASAAAKAVTLACQLAVGWPQVRRQATRTVCRRSTAQLALRAAAAVACRRLLGPLLHQLHTALALHRLAAAAAAQGASWTCLQRCVMGLLRRQGPCQSRSWQQRLIRLHAAGVAAAVAGSTTVRRGPRPLPLLAA